MGMTETKTKKLKLKGDKIIWVSIMIFAMISLLVVYSSTSALAYRWNSSPFSFMLKQLFYYIAGFGILLLCYRIPLKYYRMTTNLLLGLSALLLVIPIAMGELRTFNLFGISIQPSEIAKIAVVLYLARTIETSKLDTFKEYALRILLPVGIICCLCILGSVSVTLIICTITLVLLLCAGIKKKFILYTVLIAVGAIGVLFTVHSFTGLVPRLDTFTARVERFFTNEENMTEAELKEKEEKTFQGDQAKEAIQLGGMFGRGPGNSIKKDILPNAYDDYIFSIIVEEYGLVFGGIPVILLYLMFMYRCVIIVRSCKKKFSALTVLGLATLILMQAFLHIFVNIGVIPPTGQTLPMISKGGTSLVIMSSAFGIILSVNRTIVITADKERMEKERLEKEQAMSKDNSDNGYGKEE